VKSALPRRADVWLAAVLVAALVPYLNALPAAFTLDDVQLLATNPMATPGMSPLDWFTRPTILGSVYRPLTMLSYELNGLVSREPFGHHLVNVALHVAVTAMTFVLALALLRSRPAAGLTALLFAVHPIHTEAVTSIAGRAELLAALGALVCLHAWVRALHTRSAAWTALSVGALAAAVLCKESAYALVLLLPLVTLRVAPDGTRALLRLAPHVAVVVGSLAVRRAVIGALGEAEPPPFIDNPLAHVPFPQRLGTAVVVLADYLGTLALPLRLSADESFDQIPVVTSLVDVRLLAAVGMLAALGAVAWVTRRRAPVIAFGTAFFFAAFAVTSNVVLAIGTIKAERLVYLPSFGWCLAVGWMLRRWLGRRLGTPAAVVAAAIALLAARTVVRNDDWRDNYTLLTRTAAASPASARANANAGAMYGSAWQLDLAAAHYERAVAIRPEFVPAVIGLAGVAELRGDLERALDGYLAALRLDPTVRHAVLRAAVLLARRGEPERAAALLRGALARAPGDAELAAALAALG
jgi:hypothetical protein